MWAIMSPIRAVASRLTSVLDPVNTVRANINYNSYGQPLNATIPAALSASGTNEQTAAAYDPTTGDLTKVTTPLGDIFTRNRYDALGDPLSASAYPDTGNPATSTAPLSTSVLYDAAQMPYQITSSTGTRLNTSFTNGVITGFSVSNPNANGGAALAQRSLSRDTRGRVYSVSDSVGTAAQYRYDKNSNLTRVLDGLSNTNILRYGPMNEFVGV